MAVFPREAPVLSLLATHHGSVPTLNWPTDLTAYTHWTTYQFVKQSQSRLLTNWPAFTKNSSDFHSNTTTLNIVFSVTDSICLAQY
jgi:hypothetical protein